ncbi:CBS domain-containing protein [Streptomyces sp. TLI_171]|uniref:CBS domain-containing protein n=1 Tax=Streptomyces sp. TLI_171 TaxID=1938859 RepID=UPI00117F24EA|nr:CBS domain-containing protein [Streptomyces sp. TLI_171]
MTPRTPQPAGHSLTVADAMDPFDYQIADDSTAEQADDALRGAHVDYMPVRGHDGRCEGLVTRAGLHPFLPLPGSTERIAVGATAHQQGPFAWPTLDLLLAARVMRIRRWVVWPVIDDDGYLLGILTATRAAGVIAAPPA